MPLQPVGLVHESTPVTAGPIRPVEVSTAGTQVALSSTMDEMLRETSMAALSEAHSKTTASPPGSRNRTLLERSKPDWKAAWWIVGGVWLLGVSILTSQCLWSLRAMHYWRRSSKRASYPIDGLDPTQLAFQIGLKRKWDLRLSAGPRPPAAMTWGFMNPVVLMPNESTEWSFERLEAVLLHELAHVLRFDSVSQFIAVIGCTLYWFNPAVWLCARAMRAEAEAAADDAVIRLGVKPSTYARELLRITAELGRRRQPYSSIGVPVMKQSKIESRVKAILDPTIRTRRGVTVVEALVTLAVAGAIVLPFSSIRAAIVPRSHAHVPSVGAFEGVAQVGVPMAPTGDVKPTLSQPSSTLVVTSTKLTSEHGRLVAVRKHSARLNLRTSRSNSVTDPAKQSEIDKQKAEQKEADAQAQKAVAELNAQKARQLAELENRKGLEVQVRHLEIESNLKLAKAQYERLEALYQQGVTSNIDLDEAKAKLDKLQIEAKALREMERLSKLQAEKLYAEKLAAEKMQAEAGGLKKMAELQQQKMTALSKMQRLDSMSVSAQKKLDRVRSLLDELVRASNPKTGKGDQKRIETIKQSLVQILSAQKKADEAMMIDARIQQIRAKAEFEKASIQMAQAKEAATSTETLYQEGLVSNDQLAKAKEALRLADVQLHVAQEILETFRSRKTP
jgi:beta-lactamase regulating signal transducer with metallopeptidase domain